MWEYIEPMSSDEIYHHGILGQKWGVRRFQNSDGTLTEAGKKRYYNTLSKRADYQDAVNKYAKRAEKHKSKIPSRYFTDFGKAKTEKHMRKAAANEGKVLKYQKLIDDINKNLSELTPEQKHQSELYVAECLSDTCAGTINDQEWEKELKRYGISDSVKNEILGKQQEQKKFFDDLYKMTGNDQELVEISLMEIKDTCGVDLFDSYSDWYYRMMR